VKLESANAGYTSSLTLPEGSFRTGPGGKVSINAGSGGPRNFTAELFNEGDFTANYGVNLGRDNASHTNRGTFTVAAGVGLQLDRPGQTFRQEAGQLNLPGSFDAVGLRFDFAGGEIVGTPYLDTATLNVVPGSSRPASFILTHSASRLEGALHAGQTVWIRGDARGGHTDVTLAPDFPNRGTLRLASANAGYATSFHQDSGAFRNLPGGRLLVEPGAGGPRRLGTELRNDGEVVLSQPTTLARQNAVHVNRGTFTVAPGISLTLGGLGQTFRQEAGRLDIAGGGDFTDLRFEFLGGTLTGTPYLDGCTLLIPAANASPGSFILTRSTSRFLGELHAGQTVWVRGDGRGGHTELLLAPEFTNRGLLRLENVNAGYATAVSKPEGSLVNQAGGVIRVNPGAGGPRVIRAQLVNEGTIEANHDLTLGRAGDVHVNRGRFVLATGAGLGFTTEGQTLRQEAGELTLGGGLSGARQRLEYLGGLIEGGVYLIGSELLLGPGAGPGGNFTVTRSDTRLFGAVPAGARLTVRGDSQGGHTTAVALEGFANNGYLQVVSVNAGYTSALDVTSGALVNEAGGILEVNPGAGGPRRLGARLVNHGEFRVNYPVTLGRAGEAGESDGVIRLADNATLTLDGPLQVTGGQLAGTGIFGGDIVSRGTVAPGASAGALRFAGRFTQETRGALELELGGTEPAAFDRVTFGGATRLDGAVRVRLIGDHQPAAGNRYAVISGSFAGAPRLELPPLAAGLKWRAEFQGGLTLVVEETPATEVAITGRVTDTQNQPQSERHQRV
jgi:hypothetical protein